MSDQDIDFDLEAGSKSARKSTSRRRRDLIDDEHVDSLLDLDPNSSFKPQPTPRRGSKTKESLNLESLNESKTQPKPIAWGEKEPDLTQSQTFRPRRREVENNFSVDASQNVSDSKAFSRKLNLKEMNQNEEPEIPEIPDLEEAPEQTEDLAFQIAEAPDVQVHQIATYKELDKEFFKEKAFQFLEGNIDVSLLHCGLSTELQIAEEEDVIWEWNKLFTEVVSVLTANSDSEKNFTFDQPNEILNKPKVEESLNQTGKRERKLEF